MIGYFLIEGLYCAVHRGCETAPTAVIQGNKLVDVSRSARRSGVRPGQTKRQAMLCLPGLKLFEYDEAHYRGTLNVYLDQCYALTPVIEPCDGRSLFADFSGCPGCPSGKEPQEIVESIFGSGCYEDISVYCGLAPSKYLAWSIGNALWDGCLKSSSAGESLHWLYSDTQRIPSVISKIPVRYLWSLDADAAAELDLLGMRALADVARAGLTNLVRRYGKRGREIHNYSTGLDRTPVLPLYPPRSIVVQKAFDLVSEAGTEVYEALAGLAVEMHTRLVAANLACQRISLCIQTEIDEQVLARDFQRPVFGSKQVAWALMRLFASMGLIGPGTTASIKSFRVEASALCTPSTIQSALDDEMVPPDNSKSAIEECMAQIEPAMRALEKKYGSSLILSCSELLREESRRESMLSYWDPVRWRVANEQDH